MINSAARRSSPAAALLLWGWAAVGSAQDAGVAEVPIEPPALETVVVGTPETRTSGSVHVLKASDLQRFERDDPHAVLRAVPGVYVREEDAFGLRPNIGLRGANADRSKKITLLEDGVLFGPAPYSAPAAYYFPLITRMQSVRVLKGPSAIVHGPHTVGGSVEFITQDVPQGHLFAADLAGGEYLYGKAHGRYGFGDERTGFLIEGIHLRSNGFKELDGGGSTGFIRNEWMLKARHQLVSEGPVRQGLHLKLGYSDETSNESYLGLTDADFRADPLRRYASSALDRMQWHRTQAVLTHLLEAGRFSLRTTVYRQDFNRTWRKLNRFGGAALSDVLADPDSAANAIYYAVLSGQEDSMSPNETLFVGPNRRIFVSQGLQTVARWSGSTGPIAHAVEAGARWHFDSADRLHTEDGFRMVSGGLVAEGSPTLTNTNNRDSTQALALHVVDAIRWRALTLTPGLRFEWIGSRSVDRLAGTLTKNVIPVLLPGVGFHAAVTPQVGLFAGVHRGFSPPAPGPPGTKPELSVNYEAGARWTRREERIEVIGFFNDYSNLTDLCTFSNGCVAQDLDRQFNAGKAFIYGLEAFAQKTFRFGAGLSLPLTVAYTLSYTRLRESFDSSDPQLGRVEAGDELPYVPRHQVSATAGLESLRWGAFLSATFTDSMREIAGQGISLPGTATDRLVTLDASASWYPFARGRVYLTAKNILNAHAIVARRPFGARPNAPRMVQVGFSYGF